jgi:acetyl-CoA synthetase
MNAPTAGDSTATETHVYLPSDDFVRNATIAGMAAYEALCQEAEADYAGFWARHAA